MVDINTCNYLLNLKKEADAGIKVIDLSQPSIRLKLNSPEDAAWTFIFQIKKSLKGEYRISLHHQEHNFYTGLARIDYNSGHKNPENVNEHVPPNLISYAGKQINESHIHFNVEGYSDLSWAIPLKDYKQFSIPTVSQPSDYTNAIKEFSKFINLNINFAIIEPLI